MDEKIGYALKSRLQSAQDYDLIDVNIFLKAEPAAEAIMDFGGVPSFEDADALIGRIRSTALENQRDLISYLEGSSAGVAFADAEVAVPRVSTIDSFWITNAIGTEVTLETLRAVAERPDVAHIEVAHYAEIQELIDVRGSSAKRATASKKAMRSPKRSKKRAAAPKPSDAAAVAPAIADIAEATWSVKRINAHMLWQMGITGEGVLVAVIDSGVNYNHPDLKDNMWDGGADYPKHGYDFDADDKDPIDEGALTDGHGTACAGIVAGNGASGSRTGVAPKANIMALRVGGDERTFWRAFTFAIERRVQVISMSMSWKYPSRPDYPGWRRVCETVLAAGILHANSIGNQGEELVRFPIPYNIATPGNCPPPRLHPLQSITGEVSSPISCGATTDSDELASYSGRGPAAWETAPFTDYPYQSGARQGLIKPDVCAPGPGTTTCNWRYPGSVAANPYRPFGGTSAATPHIGGCLALLAQACRRSGNPIVPARIQEALENTAVRVSGQTRDKENHYGAGRVDIYAAFKYGETKGWWR